MTDIQWLVVGVFLGAFISIGWTLASINGNLNRIANVLESKKDNPGSTQ